MEDTISPSDPEKMQARVTTGRISDQIPHAMVEELAPNGEEEYILDKINNMTEEEAIAIVQESGRCLRLELLHSKSAPPFFSI